MSGLQLPPFLNKLSLLLLCIVSIHCSMGTSFQLNRARISIDYGPRLIGIAKSNILGSVEPHATVKNTGNLTQLSQDVIDLANSISACEIIIGIPLDVDGVMHHNVRNFNGRLCLNFSSVLSSVVVNTNTRPLRTLLFDERYTTKEAKMRLKQDKAVRGSLDAISALCLLERYIEDEAEGAIEAKPCPYPVPQDLDCFDYSVVKKYIRDLHWSSPPLKDLKSVSILSDCKHKRQKCAVDGLDKGMTASADVKSTAITDESEEEKEKEKEKEKEEELSYEEILRSRRRKKGTLKSLHLKQ